MRRQTYMINASAWMGFLRNEIGPAFSAFKTLNVSYICGWTQFFRHDGGCFPDSPPPAFAARHGDVLTSQMLGNVPKLSRQRFPTDELARPQIKRVSQRFSSNEARRCFREAWVRVTRQSARCIASRNNVNRDWIASARPLVCLSDSDERATVCWGRSTPQLKRIKFCGCFFRGKLKNGCSKPPSSG